MKKRTYKLCIIIHQTDSKDFMNLYKTCIAKPYSFLVIDATFASDDPSHFTKNFLERI